MRTKLSLKCPIWPIFPLGCARPSKNPKLPALTYSSKKEKNAILILKDYVEIVSGVEMQGIDFCFFFFPEYSHYPPEK
jgi:hypothetical protein